MRGWSDEKAERFSVVGEVGRLPRVSLSASSSRGVRAVTSAPWDAGCGGGVFSTVFSLF